MQILEASFLGLRSARLLFRDPEAGHEVTIFPMVHVGEEAFYARVQSEAFAHKTVLYEGVRSPRPRILTASYRWLDHERLGLVVQPQLDEQDTETRLVHADISGEEMSRLWKAMPLWLRIVIGLGAPLYGLYMRFAATRESIAKGMSKDMLKTSIHILEEGDEFQPMRDMIMTARDAKLAGALFGEIEGSQGPAKIAVVYGAGHVPALIRELTRMMTTMIAATKITPSIITKFIIVFYKFS